MNILSSPLCTDNISRMFSGTVRVKTERPTGQGEQLARGWLRNWANVDNDITTFGGAWQPCLYVAWFSCILSLRRWYTAQISYGNKEEIKPILNQYFSSGVDALQPFMAATSDREDDMRKWPETTDMYIQLFCAVPSSRWCQYKKLQERWSVPVPSKC